MRNHSLLWVTLAVILLRGGGLALAGEKHFLAPAPRKPIDLSREERAIVEAFERVKRSVVVLLTDEVYVAREGEELHLQPAQGQGSGVVISVEGDILTAAHVVSGARRVKARLWDGTELDASVVFTDTEADIAVVRLADGYAPVPVAVLGDSDRIVVGQSVLAVGAPLGAENSLSVGHLSARRRGNEIFGGAVVGEMLQTDAAVGRGSSGGPLVNLRGEVVGIMARILSTSGGSEGLGFAVSINTVKRLLGKEPVPWIGVNALFVGPELAAILNIPYEGALLVQSVAEGSPAARAGIRGGELPALLGGTRLVLGGDIILAIESQRACHLECIAHELQSHGRSAALYVTLWRKGEEVRLNIPVEPRRVLGRAGLAEAPGEHE